MASKPREVTRGLLNYADGARSCLDPWQRRFITSLLDRPGDRLVLSHRQWLAWLEVLSRAHRFHAQGAR